MNNEENERKYKILSDEFNKLQENKLSNDSDVLSYEKKLKEISDEYECVLESLKVSELKNKNLVESQENLNRKLTPLENDILFKQEEIKALNEQLNSIRLEFNSENGKLSQELEHSQNELKLFQEKINKQIDEYKYLAEESEVLKNKNEFYLKYLNIIKEKFNFEDFLNESNESVFIEQIERFFKDINKNNEEIERNALQWSDDLNSKNQAINKLNDELNEKIRILNENEDIIKTLTNKWDNAVKFAQEKCSILEKEKEKLLDEAKLSEEKIKKFAKKIEQVKASVEKSKTTEEKLLKSENEKKELENKYESQIQVIKKILKF